MPGVNFTLVRQAVSMAEVLGRLGFQPSHVRGAAQRGPCPVHQSTHPESRSFSVHLDRGRYQCFRCGSQGNALELWAAVHRIGVYQAAIEVCQALGLEVPWIRQW
jgi:DNA primase